VNSKESNGHTANTFLWKRKLGKMRKQLFKKKKKKRHPGMVAQNYYPNYLESGD
jgi:hypothetical protein